jgi:hypothetical protein
MGTLDGNNDITPWNYDPNSEPPYDDEHGPPPPDDDGGSGVMVPPPSDPMAVARRLSTST